MIFKNNTTDLGMPDLLRLGMSDTVPELQSVMKDIEGKQQQAKQAEQQAEQQSQQAEQQAKEESFASALATFTFFCACLIMWWLIAGMIGGIT